MTTKETGDKGENLACEYLVENGYKIIGRNYRIKFGEIDIICRKKLWTFDRTVHFVEVKTLRQAQGGAFFPEQRVDWKKQQKVKRLAEIWLSKHKYPQDIPYQIDVIAVSGDPSSGSGQVDFFENVVSE